MRSALITQQRTASAMERAAVAAATCAEYVIAAVRGRDYEETKTALTAYLAALAELQQQTTAAVDEAVGVGRQLRMSWTDLGDPLGISRQAAQQRFHGPRLTAPGEPPTKTREPRRTPRGAQK